VAGLKAAAADPSAADDVVRRDRIGPWPSLLAASNQTSMVRHKSGARIGKVAGGPDVVLGLEEFGRRTSNLPGNIVVKLKRDRGLPLVVRASQ